jgi:hypothetical protein
VDHLVLAIDSDVHLHAEIPLLTLLGLMHLRVALAIGIFGRTRCGNDRGVDDRALRQAQTASLQDATYLLEDLRSKLVLFQQVAEAHHCGFIRHRFAAQINAGERAHRARVVQRFLYRRVRQVEPQLETVNAQHPLKAHRRPPTNTARLRVIRLNHRHQVHPRHHRIHLSQKFVAPRRLAKLFEVVGRERLLFHDSYPSHTAAGTVDHRNQNARGFADIP